MSTLPNDNEFIDAAATEATFKSKFTQMLAYMRGLLGSDGAASTALGQLGIPNADGRLANIERVVGTDGLASTARQNLGLASLTLDYVDRGAWTTATLYHVDDQFTQGGIAYLVTVQHTSTTFAADQTSGYFVIQQGLNNTTGLQVINGVAALRATAVSARRVSVSYHTTAGDGGGGHFRGVTGAAPGTYVDNDTTVIVPLGGDGSSAWLMEQAEYATNLGDFPLENAIIIGVGDSTTEQMGAVGSAADEFAQMRQPGGPLATVAGMFNLGSGGYTIDHFESDPIDPAFVGPAISANLGALNWDSWFHQPSHGAISLATARKWRNNFNNHACWVVCYGINDCILQPTGNLTQAQIVSFIEAKLRLVVASILANNRTDRVILRIPNPMTARPINAAYPTSAAAPNWGTVLADDQATVEKWNQALRTAYINVQGDFPRTVVLDTWATVFGNSDTTLTATTQLPFLQNMVHPSVRGYISVADEIIKLLNPTAVVDNGRMIEAEARAVTLANNPWDNYHDYFKYSDKYRQIAHARLITIGATYIDFSINMDDFNALIDSSLDIFMGIDGLAAQQIPVGFATTGLTTTSMRIYGTTVTAAMQAVGNTLNGVNSLGVTIYQPATFKSALNPFINASVLGVKDYYTGKILNGGVGFFDMLFDESERNRFSSLFTDGLKLGSIAVGGGIDLVTPLNSVTATYTNGIPSQRSVRFVLPGDYTSWTGKKAALIFDDYVPSPKSFESKKIVGVCDATPGTSKAFAHGLGYAPSRVILSGRANGYCYQSAPADATNIYIAASLTYFSFDAYVQ